MQPMQPPLRQGQIRGGSGGDPGGQEPPQLFVIQVLIGSTVNCVVDLPYFMLERHNIILLLHAAFFPSTALAAYNHSSVVLVKIYMYLGGGTSCSLLAIGHNIPDT